MKSTARAEAPATPATENGKASSKSEILERAKRRLEAVPGGTAKDANALQALLDRHFRESGDETIQAKPPVAVPTPPSRWRSRLTKSALGLVLILIAGWMPMQRLFQVSSVEAVVNARLV